MNGLTDLPCAEQDLDLFGVQVLVCGYGAVGKACARALQRVGAGVQVVEVEPTSALQAWMDGLEVVHLSSALATADIILETLDLLRSLRPEHYRRMKAGALIGSSRNDDGIAQLVQADGVEVREVFRQVRELRFPDGHRLLAFESPAALSGGLLPPRSRSQDSQCRATADLVGEMRPFISWLARVKQGADAKGSAERRSQADDPVTTLMICNLARGVTQPKLFEAAEEVSGQFGGQFDYLYMPPSRQRSQTASQNLGYAFINFPDPADAQGFMQHLTDYCFHKGTDKPCVVKWAEPQGFEQQILTYARSLRERRHPPHRGPIFREVVEPHRRVQLRSSMVNVLSL